MARWLRKAKGDFTPWPWTEVLAARADMVEITDEEARRFLGAAPAVAVPHEDAGGDKPVIPGMTADDILALVDKDQLVAIADDLGVELDKRKSVKSLQADLISALGLGQ